MEPVSLLARVAFAAGSGAALSLAFPPFGFGPLVVAAAGLLLAVRGARPRVRIGLGVLFGVAFFGPLLSWVGEAGLHAWVALTLTDVALTRTIPAGSVDLVVWPEGVVDLEAPRPSIGEPAPPPLADLAGSLDSWILAGVVSDAGPGRFRNSALSVEPSGLVGGVYDKQRAVPFGEYVPWRRYLGFITALRAVPKDMVGGSNPQLLPVPGGRVGTPVSYEIAFPRIVRGFAAEGAEAIVVPTNTSSFGADVATAEQQLLSTRMRARELRLWIIQSAPSGISAIVGPDGRVVARTELYEPAILRDAITLTPSVTPFARWGEGPVVLLATLAVIASALGQRSSSNKNAAPALLHHVVGSSRARILRRVVEDRSGEARG